MNLLPKTREALSVAFGTAILPHWLLAGFNARIRGDRLVFVCAHCRAGHAFEVGRELTIVQTLNLQNHKTMHDLNLDPLEEPAR